jgi:dihydrofolate reductase
MPKLRVHSVAVSLDGYMAGPDQALERPLGAGGERLHTWAFATRTTRRQFGMTGGSEGVDDDFIAAGTENIGATIMGRNMFGPIRGSWAGSDWTGWWGDEPPYHHPVFVLTHHQREPLEMKGGTTFHFVPDGIHVARERALEAAAGKDVRVGGGAATIAQFLRAGLIDEMHLAYVPLLLGGGERVFPDPECSRDYECVGMVGSATVAHARFLRRDPPSP